MKIQTYPLPTGEFMLVLSEAPAALKLDDMRESTGAAYILATSEPVEVEWTDFDEKACRADRPIKLAYPVLPTIQAKQEAERDFLSRIDQNVFAQIQAGEEFSPAGLVVNNGKSVGRAAEPQEKPLPHPDMHWLGSHDVVVGTGGPVDKPAVPEVLTGGWDH
jgi:hypothetical protein